MVATTEPMQHVRQLPTKVFHFLMWFSDLAPLHMVLIIHRLHTQRTFDESNSLSPYLGCTLLSQFSASTTFLCVLIDFLCSYGSICLSTHGFPLENTHAKSHLVITGTSPPPIFFPVKAGLRKSVKKSARPTVGSRTPLSPAWCPWHFQLCYRRHRCNNGL